MYELPLQREGVSNVRERIDRITFCHVKNKGEDMFLFKPGKIGTMQLPNRVVRSATHEGFADEQGNVTDNLVRYWDRLAKAQLGAVISGHCYVVTQGKASRGQIGIYSDEQVVGLRRLVDKMHAHTTPIVLQLAHAGAAAPESVTKTVALGPSGKRVKGKIVVKRMTLKEIHETVRAFVQAAARAARAGFDALQIHAAHGYLLSQFLSPYYNTRDDAYGGDLRNRARMLLEIVEKIVKMQAIPLIVKLNSEDFLQGGFTQDEMVQVSMWLQERGVAALELSGGTFDSGEFSPARKGAENQHGYYRDAWRKVKEKCNIPVIGVGGIRTYEEAEQLLEKGVLDFVALSRPFIREPALVLRWLNNDLRPARCISCNRCFRTALTAKGLFCAVENNRL